MKIELRNVTYNARLSEETSAFAASIYIDGKREGEVKNDGHGGAHMYYPHSVEERISVHAATLPRRPFGFGMDGDYQPSSDTVIDDLLTDVLLGKDLKRMLSKKVVYLRENVLYTMKKGGTPRGPEKVLNDMPFDDAFAIFREHAHR